MKLLTILNMCRTHHPEKKKLKTRKRKVVNLEKNTSRLKMGMIIRYKGKENSVEILGGFSFQNGRAGTG